MTINLDDTQKDSLIDRIYFHPLMFGLFIWGAFGWIGAICFLIIEHGNHWHLGWLSIGLGLSSFICWIPMYIIDEIHGDYCVRQGRKMIVDKIAEGKLSADRLDMYNRSF